MFKVIKNKLKWLFASDELSELNRYKVNIRNYQRCLASFDNINMVLENLQNECEYNHDNKIVSISKLRRIIKKSEFIETKNTNVNCIVCSAIYIPDLNIIIPGIRHCDKIMINLYNVLNISNDDLNNSIEGFLDKNGNFVNRQEAFIIAKKANQIFRLVKKQTKINIENGITKLFSENIY